MTKMSFIEKLNSLRANRKGDENAFLNLISSLYTERMFVYVLLAQKLSENWTKTIISHYIVSLVTCWETFFRDVFVFLLKRNPSIASEHAQNARVRKALGRAPGSEPDQTEYIASLFNFQNLESLLDAFGPFFGEDGSLDLPTNEHVLVNSKRYGWSMFSLPAIFPDWKENLDFILQERHRIIHDANHSCTVSRKDIRELEAVLFFYLQLFGILVSGRFELPWIKLDITTSVLSITFGTNSDWRNIVITFDDLLSDDWETLA
jgi:hypothetical protein